MSAETCELTLPQRYAMKFINDSDAKPTNAEIVRVLGECVRPPEPNEFSAIRAAVFAWRQETGLRSRIERVA